MRRSPNYILKEIEGHFYIIPFADANAKFAKDVEVNEVGAFIWNLLEEDHEAEEIVDACMKEYECPKEQRGTIKTVVEAFFDHMFENGLLEWTIKRKPLRKDVLRKYAIAGLNMLVYGSGDLDLSPLEPYIAKRSRPADTLTINLVCLKKEDIERIETISPGETFIARTDALEVYKGSYGYRLEVKDCKYVARIWINNSGDYSLIEYCEGENDIVSNELFSAMRIPFTNFAGQHGLVAIHSASIVYRGKGWLFSGRSQMGKTTHTNLWKEFESVKIFNGDLNLLGLKDSLIYMYGVPWCGESGITEPGSYRVSGITFLKQAPVNRVKKVTGGERVLKILRRLFSPSWTEKQLTSNYEVSRIIAETVSICELECTVDKEAFEVMKAYIDDTVS